MSNLADKHGGFMSRNKGHGCLWYVVVFPIISPFYIAYYMFAIPIKLLLNSSNKQSKKLPKQYIPYSNNISGYNFEYICANYLRNCGFINVYVTRGSGDQGADIIAWKNGFKYAVQCKYYQKPVGNKAVQEAYSAKAYYNCNIAMVMTNSSFTQSAIDLARATGVILEPYVQNNYNINKKSQTNYYSTNSINNLNVSSHKKMNNYELESFARQCNAYVEKMERNNYD